MKILVIEDDQDTAELVRQSLELDGHEVSVANSAAEAISEAKSFKPDLVFADWDLSDSLDGIDVCSIIQNYLPSVKVILVSGSPREEVLGAAENLTSVTLISKPYALEELRTAIETEMQKLQ